MTPGNKKESALGRGLDALIRKDYLDKDEKPKPRKTRAKSATSANKSKSSKAPKKVQDTRNLNADDRVIDAVLVEVHKNPRISLWSAKSAAVLRFLKKTKPEFSISNEASLLIEEAVKDRHPEIWKLFEEKGL